MVVLAQAFTKKLGISAEHAETQRYIQYKDI